MLVKIYFFKFYFLVSHGIEEILKDASKKYNMDEEDEDDEEFVIEKVLGKITMP